MWFCGVDMDQARALELPQGRCFVFSRRCPGKESPNEDSAAVTVYDRDRALLVVADGLGGAPRGDEASKIAVQIVTKTWSSAVEKGIGAREGILAGIELAKAKVAALGDGAATTLAAVGIEGSRARIYHVGDSEVFHTGNRGVLRWRTTPHSPVGYAVEAGILSVDDAVQADHRHLVSNVVGEGSMTIEMSNVLELKRHDSLLLCSDGLVDNLFESEIVERACKGPPERCARTLLELADRRMSTEDDEHPSKLDDLTLVLYRHGLPRRRVPAKAS